MSSLNGFLNVNKTAGMTSAAVVARVKKLLPKKTRIGHTGTLDPNVTGVLPLAIGRATKAIAFLDDEEKVYQASLRFGIRTTTADIWGEVVESVEPKCIDLTEIESALAEFIGESEQIPPMFSALKQNGKRLYELARAGEVVERKARKITISKIDVISYDFPELSFKVHCSRGTYVRTLCEDIAKELGTIATMTELVRLQTAVFDLEHAYELKEINSENMTNILLPVDFLFLNLTKIQVDAIHAKHLYNGVKVNLARFYKGERKELYAVYYENDFIGVAKNGEDGIFMAKLLGDNEL